MLFDSGCSSAAILSVAAKSVDIVPVSHKCKLATFDSDQTVVRDFASFEIMSLDRTVCFGAGSIGWRFLDSEWR